MHITLNSLNVQSTTVALYLKKINDLIEVVNSIKITVI